MPANEPRGRFSPVTERLAILSDLHLAPPGTPDGRWNNTTRLSASQDLLETAAAEISAAGHDRVLLLGDVSDAGAADVIGAAADVITAAGLQPWIVVGNHDVMALPDVLALALEGRKTAALSLDWLGPPGKFLVCGHGLRSDDGGHSCRATGLPDLGQAPGRLLLWASHYPVLSQRARLGSAGLRYPGDLVNLEQVTGCVARFRGPALVLHGHLHAAVVSQDGPILQIGVPAVVEWPHAWTDVSLQISDDEVIVRTRLIPITGSWSAPSRDTVLAQGVQNWVFTTGRWQQTAGSGALAAARRAEAEARS
jgi:3',5'-cyclic AMP phosphodiesterase CpdA